MLSWFKTDPVTKLRKEYGRKMKEAMLLQRSGKMAAYAEKSAEAEAISRKIDELTCKA